MPSVCFLDTNVLVYAALRDENDSRKFGIARSIVAAESFCLSAQVLAEFYVSVAIKPKPPLAASEVDRWIKLLSRFPTLALDADVVQAGFAFARRYQVHYYDGAILAAAEWLGATVLYTEDLNHGQHYGPVRVLNPFL